MDQQNRAIVVVAHGSRISRANEDVRKVADYLRENEEGTLVIPAYLELQKPDIQSAIESAADQGASEIVVLPYFLFPGTHVQKDIPEIIENTRMRYPVIRIVLAGHIGYHPKMGQILLQSLAGLRENI